MASHIPKSHPRYESLATRERMRQALLRGLVHETGMIAHGRGEAFDYLLGERTTATARRAIRAAAAALRRAKRPVVSVNGNVVALAAREAVGVARVLQAPIEVNLFHRTEARVRRLVRELERQGARHVLGPNPDARIPGLDSDRAKCHRDGIFGADVVLVPLEDGDRAQALRRMGKFVIAVDLNPLSRTARTADVTIVDDVRRALRLLVSDLRGGRTPLRAFDNRANLRRVLRALQANLRKASRRARP